MGQQQILFLILGVCFVGVAIATGFVSIQDQGLMDRRALLVEDLHQIASRAQAFYRRPIQEGGGDSSFLVLTSTTHGLSMLHATPAPLHGEFWIKRTGSSSRLELIGVGTEGGRNPSCPIRVMLTVWPDSTALTILN